MLASSIFSFLKTKSSNSFRNHWLNHTVRILSYSSSCLLIYNKQYLLHQWLFIMYEVIYNIFVYVNHLTVYFHFCVIIHLSISTYIIAIQMVFALNQNQNQNRKTLQSDKSSKYTIMTITKIYLS